MKLRTKSTSVVLIAAAAAFASTLGFGTSKALAAAPIGDPPFDWSVLDNSGNPAYTPTPVLTDTSAASVRDFLIARHTADPNAVLAVKTVGPISDASAATVFNAVAVKYVFADIEDANYVAETAHLVNNQLRGPGSQSGNAFVGEFNLAKYPSDPTSAGPQASSLSFANTMQGKYTNAGLAGAGVNGMSNPALYPGSPDYASAQQASNSNTPAPNIRSALFVLPTYRLTYATVYGGNQTYPTTAEYGGGATTLLTPGSGTVIPWVSRFNNWGNSALNNTVVAGYQYAYATSDQLLSRNDFAAQVLQYRLRGATNFNLFNYDAGGINSSVIGYSAASEQADAIRGWTAGGAYNGVSVVGGNSILNNILSRSGSQYGFTNLVNKVPGATPGSKSIGGIQAGMVLSGVYDKTVNGQGMRTMAMLLSNLSPSSKRVSFWQTVGGSAIDLNPSVAGNQQLETIAPGSHELLTFVLSGNVWRLNDNVTGQGAGIFGDPMFNTGGAAANSRSGIGVPEPTSLGLLGLGGLGLLARRRRSC